VSANARRNIDHEFYDLVSDPRVPLRDAVKLRARLIRRKNERNPLFMWHMAAVFRLERERQVDVGRWEADGGAPIR
jgi:hypothetical protein